MTNTVTTDSDAWSSVTEQSIFLDDGLKFLVEVLQPPAISTEHSTFVERISEHKFETSSNAELRKRLLKTCALQHSSYYKLFDYRQRALLGLWQSQKSKIIPLSSKNSCPPAVDSKEGKPKVPFQDDSFSSHISLLLLVPILESQSRTDPSLAGQCSELLLQCLQNCAPNSLAAEPTSCIKGLANLLCNWLQQANDEENISRQEELARCGVKRESLVAALVSLACARLSVHLFIQVLDILLQQRTPLTKLPVGAVLKRMVEYERKGFFSESSVIQTSRFISSWKFDTNLTEFDDSINNSDQINTLACDGKFLYHVSEESKGLVKIGTGKWGTVRSAVYARNADLKNGWLTIVQDRLLFRPKQFDTQPANLCYVLDVVSLKVLQTIKFRDAVEPGADEMQTLQCRTIQLLSDQVHLFWLWCSTPTESASQENRKVDLWLQEFKLEACDDKLKASPCGEPVVVSKKEEPPSCLSSPLPVRHSPTTPTGQKDAEDIVSCGVSMGTLKQSAMFISGETLVIVVPHLTSPSGPMLLTLRGQKSPTNYCFSTVDGSCVKHESVVNSASSKWQDLIAPGLSVCHDVVNSRLWSYCCSHIGEWVSGGLPSCNQISQLLGTSGSQSSAVTTQGSVDPVEASSLLAHHITYLCRRQDAKTKVASTKNEEIHFGDTSDFCNIRHINNVLNAAITNGQHDVTIAMLVALQTLMIQVSERANKLDDNSVKGTKHLVWKLLQSPADSVGAEIKLEAFKVLTVGLEVFYSTPSVRSALLMLLLSEGESSSDMAMLLNFLLSNLTENLISHKPGASSNERLAEDVVFAALKVSVKESCHLIMQCCSLEDEPFCALVAKHPDLSPVLHYVTTVFTRSWRDFVLPEEQESDVKGFDDAVKPVDCQKLSLIVLEACQQILDVVLEVLSKLSEECKGGVKSRVEGLEHVMKATLVGQTLPMLASVLSSDRCLTLSMAKSFLQSVTNVTVTAARVAHFISELKSSSQDDAKDECQAPSPESSTFLSPWLRPRKVESPHPVRDAYQCCETVVLPGVSCLYLNFDLRCATQYDYDKVLVYAGNNTNGRKVAEFGGNSHGAGSRGVVQMGWPKEPLKVEGDAVTISFQVKSSRERNTPDVAVWGFSCIVSTKEYKEEPSTLLFFDDLYLSLSLLTHSLLKVRYQGPANTEAEDACQHLLDSKLLQRCVWPTSADASTASGTCGTAITVESEKSSPSSLESVSSKPSVKLSPDLLKRLRVASGILAPTLRPSLQQAILPEAIEEVVVRCAINHLGLSKTVNGLELLQATETDGEEYSYLCDVMREVYNRLNGLIRQLQTMAEMEQKWAHEMEDVRSGILQPSAAFFDEFHLQEAKSKELELLCSLKNVEFDPIEQEKSVGKLIERLDTEARAEPQQAKNGLNVMPVTKKFLFSIMECAELLCNVTIEASRKKPVPERTISHCSFAPDHGQQSKQVTSKDENLAPSSPLLSRSFSAPSTLDQSTSLQEGIHDIRRLQRWRTNVQKKHSRVSSENQTDSDARTFVSTVAEIFTFIGSNPDKAVTCSSFLAAARVRNERGLDRVHALQCMIELVTVCSRLGLHLPYVMTAVASILAQGPRPEELKCGGIVREVRDMFSAAVQAVVQRASSEPEVYRDSALVLSVCPFSWHEERCVMRSGLVYLLDKLCSIRSKKTDTALNLSAMAWAGFQVLLDRIVQWENGKDFCLGAIEWSGLAHQVSSLLSNYLSCVFEEGRKDGVSSRDALQYVMELLHGISRSKLGDGILREPRTISTLLSLLLDREAPPKLILIVLKLCCLALPLMSAKSCEEVELPSSAKLYFGEKHEKSLEGSSVVRVAKLFLAKLGDFLLPSLSPEREEDQEEEVDEYDDSEIAHKDEDSMCVYVHKRDDQPAHEIVRKVLSMISMGFFFVVGHGSELERAVKLDQELTEYGQGVLLTDTLSECLKKAAEWAQKGLVVSIGPAALAEGDGGQGIPLVGSGDPERVCKARNSRLSRTETSRPFISGQVAHTMASEVISLLHGFLTHSTSETAKIWASSVRDVLCEALNYVPDLVRTLEAEGRISSDGPQTALKELDSEDDEKTGHEQEWIFKARSIMASLCAVGGFGQSIHPGCTVLITGEDMVRTTGEVVSVSERQGVATVLLDKGGESYSDRVQEIPLARLEVANAQVVYLTELSMEQQTVAALLTILNSKEITFDQLLEADKNEKVVPPSPAARILAEMKTRASMVLSAQMHDSSFITAILSNPSFELISRLSGECDPGLRLPVIQKHCQQLRKLFKDFVKPEPPKKVTKIEKKIVLDGSQVFPPVRGCVFTEGHTCVHFMDDPTAGSGLPRGLFVYASSPLPQMAPSFYWEIELCSLGDKEEPEPGPCISVGFAPKTDQPASGWVNPVGSCLLHSNGRAVLYRTGGLLQWKTVSLNIVMKERDVIGCGYKRAEDQADRGMVYFTCNGERLAEGVDGVQTGLWPVLHIQKKNVRVRVNFGSRSFLYEEGSKHRLAADLWSDSLVDVRQGFTELPFALEPDQDEEIKGQKPPKVCKPSPPTPAPLDIPKDSAKEYDPLACLQYKLTSSYNRMTDVGPVTPLRASEESNSQWGEAPPVDPSRLLVKAWEDKVFPIIRRRFRSNADRQSGLEQIKGALLAGMTEIAIATVADLYEDNGGIPPILQFPTLDDVKADVNKVSAGGLRPGQAVIINSPALNQAACVPGFAVPDMKKTFGLTGVVKSVDKPQGLAEVETYNREEGILMRFWYPICTLERPTAGLARSSSLALCSEDRTRADLYCELLRNEACMTRMYCREAHARLLAKLAESHNQISDVLSLLQALTAQLLAVPQSDGSIIMTSPHSAPGPRHCLTANTLQPSTIFFSEPAKLISEFRKLLSLAADQDEENVLRMVSTVCEVLKDPPLGGHHREMSVAAGKEDEEVYFPGAAVTVVSCREDPGCLNAGCLSNPKSPCVSISCYHGNQKVNKNGQVARYKVVQYPNTAEPNSSASAGAHLFPDVILPCNRLDVRFFSSATEGLMLHLNAFPAEFFMSLVFIEVFISFYLENSLEGFRNSKNKSTSGVEDVSSRISLNQRTIVYNLIDILSSFLMKSDLPVVVKEIIYHLLAQLIRACHLVESQGNQSHSADHCSTLDLALSRLSPLRVELQKLLEKELSVTNTAALDFILNCNFEHSEFSSYLQALLGLVSATNEVSSSQGKSGRGMSLKEVREALQAAVSLDETDNVVRSAPPESVDNMFNFEAEAVYPPSATETAASSGPPSPKVKASERRGSVRRRKRGFGHGVTSPTESMPWFDKVVGTTLLLRNLIHKDSRGSSQLSDSLAAVIASKSTALQRLLIITNISTSLSKREAVEAIKKACRPSGGIYESVLYIPVVESRSKTEEPGKKKESEEVDSRLKSVTELLPSAQREKPDKILGYAVVELKSSSQLELVYQTLMSSKTLKDPSSTDSTVGVAKVNSELLMEGTNELAAFSVFDEFLNARLYTDATAKLLSESAKTALAEIFSSCALVSRDDSSNAAEARSTSVDSVTDTALQTAAVELQKADTVSEGSTNKAEDTESQGQVETDSRSQEIPRRDTDSLSSNGVQSKTQSNQSNFASITKVLLTNDQICRVKPGNLLLSFFNAVRHAKESTTQLVTQILRNYGSPVEGTDERVLGLDGFHNWALSRGSQDVRSIWKGLIACGYDLQFKRCTYFLPSEMESDHANWPVARDHALVLYVDTLCRAWSTTPSRLMPDELLLSEVDLTSEDFRQLQGVSLRSLRSRFAFLKSLNADVERLLLPVTDFRAAETFNLSTAALLRDARGLLFYHTKVALLNHVLNHTAHREADDPPPEVSIDPLQSLEVDKVSSAGPQFCQAAHNITAVTSSGLRVKVATGGDPVFPLKVVLQGEQVLGSGGSFRHFMWLMARELQGNHVGLLVPCPSSAANKNKGKFILKPGPMTYAEEELLIFFGQLLGIAQRADIPLALDLLPCFWKSLLNLPLDPQDDLRETDILTYNYLRRFSEVESAEEFQTLCFEADLCPYRFVYTSLDGEEVELCENGADVAVTWENHKSYVQAIRDLRLKELRCESRMAAVRCGLSSVVPLHVLTVMTPLDMEIRTCGQPSLDLGFLKAHTCYVAGVKDTDVHIEYFWNTMESFSQDQLRKFVKFACNQERLPSRCTCQDGNPNTADVHVPPYPMKIGPPDGRGPSDARYIRVETCMFMVKLPQYSTQEIMTEKLLYAINCREDPLTDIT